MPFCVTITELSCDGTTKQNDWHERIAPERLTRNKWCRRLIDKALQFLSHSFPLHSYLHALSLVYLAVNYATAPGTSVSCKAALQHITVCVRTQYRRSRLERADKALSVRLLLFGGHLISLKMDARHVSTLNFYSSHMFGPQKDIQMYCNCFCKLFHQ